MYTKEQVATAHAMLQSGQSGAVSMQKQLARLFVAVFVGDNNRTASGSIAVLRNFSAAVRESFDKATWSNVKTPVSMIVRILTLSGALVAPAWASDDFETFPIQKTYRALSKYDASGNLKPEPNVRDQVRKYFDRIVAKHGATVLFEVFESWKNVQVVGSEDDSDGDDNVARINPFAEVSTK